MRVQPHIQDQNWLNHSLTVIAVSAAQLRNPVPVNDPFKWADDFDVAGGWSGSVIVDDD